MSKSPNSNTRYRESQSLSPPLEVLALPFAPFFIFSLSAFLRSFYKSKTQRQSCLINNVHQSLTSRAFALFGLVILVGMAPARS